MADLYDGTTKTARHFFDANDKATWVIFDPATGAVQGTVQGTVKAKAARQRQVDDGGFGSVDALLLTATQGTGAHAPLACLFMCDVGTPRPGGDHTYAEHCAHN